MYLRLSVDGSNYIFTLMNEQTRYFKHVPYVGTIISEYYVEDNIPVIDFLRKCTKSPKR